MFSHCRAYSHLCDCRGRIIAAPLQRFAQRSLALPALLGARSTGARTPLFLASARECPLFAAAAVVAAKTMAEVAKLDALGPFSKRVLDDTWGVGLWRPARRFGVPQGVDRAR